jgi:thiosulfate reductase cytochrome b subunit
MRHRELFHPLPVRLWHWFHAACVVVLIATGIQIRYQLLTWITFKSAVELHNGAALALLVSFGFWSVYHLVTGKLRAYVPKVDRAWPFAIWRQVRYYAFGILRAEDNPHPISAASKFNPLQQLTYLIVMGILLPAQIGTGILLWDPRRFSAALNSLGGLKLVANSHVVLFVLFVVFVIVHVYLITLGHSPTAHLKAMWTGYEDPDPRASKK